jgi:predicted nucleic acid-binding protein
MSGMVVLTDTNVILDHLIPRSPYMDMAGTVFQQCFQRKCTGYVAAHSITNIFYILRKQFSPDERKRILRGLCDFIEIAGVQKRQLIDALNDETFSSLDMTSSEC